MLEWIKKWWDTVIMIGFFVFVIIGVILVARWIESKNEQIQGLSTKLITSEQTLEVERGTFARRAHEIEDLKDLLTKTGEENVSLKSLLDRANAEILTLNQVVIKWKKAYEVLLAGTQTTAPPATPDGPRRIKVEFDGRAGPMRLWGHTLTDPPEALLRWEQVDPLRLTIAVTRNRDGTFSSIVQSSDMDVAADITVAAVDPTVLRPSWKQRIWIDGGMDFLGSRRASLGASYHLDRVSLGLSCSIHEQGSGCGLTAGFRPFR